MPNGALENSARAALRGGNFLLWVTFGLSFLVNVLQLAGPLFIILIYDRVLTSRSEETLFALLFMVVILLIALGVLDYTRKRLVARFAAQFQERLEDTILGAAQQNAMFPTGTTKPVVGLDETDNLRGFFHSGGLIAVMDFIWAPMFLTVLFILHPVIGYICTIGLLVMTALVFVRLAFLGARQERASGSAQRIGDLKKMVTASREVVRGQDMSPGFKTLWKRERQDGRDNAIALRDWTASFDQMSSTTLQLVRYGVLAAGAWLVLEGKLTVGAMVAGAFLVTRVLLPVNTFARTVPSIFNALENWKRLKKILASWDNPASRPFPTAPANSRNLLALKNLSVKSPLDNTMVLKSVNLTLAAGTMTEIRGKSGQGKTAMAEAILGIAPHSGGSVLVNGINIKRMTDAELAGSIGYVPEIPRFIAGTIAENISRLDPDMTPEKVSHAARQACLHGWITALPKGYQTELDPAGTVLSKGKRQQLSLARALYNNPRILVIDEMDRMLTDRLPETMAKTFKSILDRNGAILIFGRRSITMELEKTEYRLDKGSLGPPKKVAQNDDKPGKTSVEVGSKVTVLGDNKISKVLPDG